LGQAIWCIYAFCERDGRSVICFAHVTNAMAQTEGKETSKDETNGTTATLAIVAAAIRALSGSPRRPGFY
jgi:hypothetical protein